MTIEALLFYFFAVTGVGSAVAMVIAKNAVHAALLLVAVQVALAIMFLLQGAFFIAALQVIVYAGAIMVLFIFVVMLLGVDKKEALVERLAFQRTLAVGLGLLLVAQIAYLAVRGALEVASEPVVKALPGEGNVEAVARVLFTNWALPFEATSILLVVAVVGAMVLAKRRIEG